MRSVSIVIPVLNGAETIERTVRSALEQRYDGEFEVVVVDNGSNDGTPDIVKRESVRLVNEARRSRSVARNRGAHEALHEVLAFCDADCTLPPTWLADATAALDKEWIGGVQARIKKHDLPVPDRSFVHARWGLPFLDTCALAVTRRAFQDAEGFDESLGRNEDMDFSFRLLARGYALGVLVDTVAIKHHDLRYDQALRRGWNDGRSLAQVDARWLARMPPARKRRLGALRYWLRRAVLSRPDALESIEKSASFAGYLTTDLSSRDKQQNECRALTRLPEVLGWDKSLVKMGDAGVLFDARRYRQDKLDFVAFHALARLIDEPLNRNDLVASLRRELGVSETRAQTSVSRLYQLLEG